MNDSRTLVDAGEFGQTLKELAEREQRSISQMGRILIQEAIKARQQERSISFGNLLRSLDELSPEELISTAEKIFELLKNTVESNTVAKRKAAPIQLKAFLTQLADGELPTNGQLVTLAHDLGVPTETLMLIRDRIFQQKEREQANGT
jgi:hypothetical protein